MLSSFQKGMILIISFLNTFVKNSEKPEKSFKDKESLFTKLS